MNTKVLKQINFLSIVLGAMLGLITAIPFIGSIAFWILMCIASTIIITMMTKSELLIINSVRESAVLGAIIGFTSFLGFSLFYVPIIIILAKYFNIYPNYGISMALSNASLGVIIIFVIFVAILSATLNAFSGFLTFYGINFFKSNNNEHTSFKLK